MIFIYRLDLPDVIFATHDEWQESDVTAKYPGSFFGAKRGVGSGSCSPADPMPSVGLTILNLNVNLTITTDQKMALGLK